MFVGFLIIIKLVEEEEEGEEWELRRVEMENVMSL